MVKKTKKKAKITDAGLKCACGREAKPAKLSFQGEAIDGWQCVCGAKYHDPGQAQRILSLNKLRSQSVSVKLGRMKSNLFLRIPTAVSELLALKQGETVNLRVKGLKEFEVNC
jgi:hypothetical protein